MKSSQTFPLQCETEQSLRKNNQPKVSSVLSRKTTMFPNVLQKQEERKLVYKSFEELLIFSSRGQRSG